MEDPLLTIELVPRSSFYKNLRAHLPKRAWDRIRKKIYKEANYHCEICGGKGSRHPVECHEIWAYDDENNVQRLTGFQALCPACHLVKHAGRASVKGLWEEAMEQLGKVNGWSVEEAERYANRQFAIWGKRSRHEWSQDLSLLEESPYKEWLEGIEIDLSGKEA